MVSSIAFLLLSLNENGSLWLLITFLFLFPFCVYNLMNFFIFLYSSIIVILGEEWEMVEEYNGKLGGGGKGNRDKRERRSRKRE